MAEKYNEKEYNIKKPYFNVRNKAWEFLIENKVTRYPLDLRQIANQNNWNIWSYKEYCQLKNINELDLINEHPDGFTFKLDNGTQLICYNQNNNRWRNRFTIAHEMGHITLHKYLSGNELEKEANMFAARILMPMIHIKELNIKSAKELSLLCDVSIESASFRLKRYKEIEKRGKFYSNIYEKELLKQLKPFINRFKT